MANSGSDKELMREAVSLDYSTEQGPKNVVFSIIIPEGYALELHSCEFLGLPTAVTNLNTHLLVDDPDEEDNPGHTAEKVLASWINAMATVVGFVDQRSIHDCHKQLLVQPPNFIMDTASSDATFSTFCRIWFDFVKISPSKILELLRQQQY